MSAVSAAPTSGSVPSYAEQAPTKDPLPPLPSHVTTALDSATRKTYYIDHKSKTTSFQHPTHRPIYTEGLPWPYERQFDAKGRAYYLNHETKTSSWLNPVKKEHWERTGEIGPLAVGWFGEDGKDVVVEEITNDGKKYIVNYSVGEVGGPD
jgi:hypothetical protein